MFFSVVEVLHKVRVDEVNHHFVETIRHNCVVFRVDFPEQPQPESFAFFFEYFLVYWEVQRLKWYL